MNEVLSQDEIDALVNNLAEGKIVSDSMEDIEPQKKIRIYDFKRPNKFSKNHLNFLQNIHENYLRSIKTYLTARLHTTISTKIVSVEQLTYDEFIRSLPNPTVLGVFSLEPLEGMFLIEMSPSLSFTMIERLLGGGGKEYKENRDLTEIEKTVIEHRLKQMISLFQEAWSEVYEVKPNFAALETNPQFTQIVAPNEMIVLVTIEVLIGGVYGIINICLPYLVLEPILDKLSTVFLFSSQAKKNTVSESKTIKKKIENISVETAVLLGQTEILVRDLLELSPGDVIPLSMGIDEQLPVYVGNFIKFKGVPGVYRNHLALQVTEVLTEVGDEKNE